MKRLAILIPLLALAGCGSAYKVSVYGRSGAVFTAPSLCAALIECENSPESACYYDRTLYVDANGKLDESGCKEVKK